MSQIKTRLLFFLLLLLFLLPGKTVFAEKGRWVQLGKEWTYADEFGNVIPGWLEYKGSWYFIDAGRERIATGWIFDRGKWYFLSNHESDSGKMHRFWATIDGYAYYFDESGAMAEKTTVQGKYKVNDQGQYLGADGKPKYYEKSGFRTKPSTVIDELMAKAKKELSQLDKPQISGRGNPSFTARYGPSPNGIFDPGPQNPWAEKENINMQQYDMKEEYTEENTDGEDDGADEEDDYEEDKDEDEE